MLVHPNEQKGFSVTPFYPPHHGGREPTIFDRRRAIIHYRVARFLKDHEGLCVHIGVLRLIGERPERRWGGLYEDLLTIRQLLQRRIIALYSPPQRFRTLFEERALLDPLLEDLERRWLREPGPRKPPPA